MSDAFRHCIRCGEDKPALEFYASAAYCKPCMAVVTWEGKLKREYGLTVHTYGQLLATQENRCAICRADLTETTAHVDHCHENGQVRGILCQRCNVAIGQFGDDPARIRKAIAYIGQTR